MSSQDERGPLLSEADSESRVWRPRQALFLIILVFGYMSCVVPVSLGPVAIPTWEDDTAFAWAKQHSKLYIASGYVCEGLGYIMLGHLSDHVGGNTMVSSFLVLSAGIVAMQAFVQVPMAMVTLGMLLEFLKGVCWPAAMSLVGLNLPAWRFEVALLFLGMASRLSDAFADTVFGTLLHYFEWRTVFCIFSAGILLTSIGFTSLMYLQRQEPASNAAAVQGERGPQGQGTSPLALPESASVNAARMLSNPDFALICGNEIAVATMWIFSSFLATFARQIWHASDQSSAQMASAFPLGELSGILLGVAILSFVGPSKGRRTLYVVTAAMLGLSVICPVLILTLNDMPLLNYAILSFFLGLLTVQCSYVPTGVFVIHEGRRLDAVAFFSGIVEGIVSLYGGTLSLLIGSLREDSEVLAFRTLLWSCIASAGIGTVLLTTYIRRNWDKPVFSPVEPGRTPKKVDFQVVC